MSNPKDRLLKNISANWAGLLLNAAVAFFLQPFLVNQLGVALFGVWALVFSIIAYMEFLDLGVRQSLSRYLPKYYAVRDFVGLNKVINSGVVFYGLVAVATVIATLIVANFGVGGFDIEESLVGTMKWTLILIGLNSAVEFVATPVSALGAFHRWDLSNYVNMSTKILGTAAIVTIVLLNYGLVALAIVAVVTTTVKVLTKHVLLRRIVPEMSINPTMADRETFRELFGYGIYAFLIGITLMVIFNTDNIVIGMFISTTSVTYYAIALTVMAYLRNIISASCLPLVPTMSHLEATGSSKDVADLSSKLLRYTFFICACGSFGILIFGDEFILLWMGEGFGLTVEILHILVIPAIFFLPMSTSFSILLGLGHPKPLFYVLAAEALSNVVLSIILVQQIGIHGVALGTAIPQMLIYTAVYPIVLFRIIQQPVSQFYRIASKMIVLAAVCTVPVGLLLDRLISVDSWVSFVLVVGITSAIFLAAFLRFILAPEDRARLLKRFRRQ